MRARVEKVEATLERQAVANGSAPGVTAVEAPIPTPSTSYSELALLVNGLTNDSLCLIYSSCSKVIALQWVL